MSEAIKIDQALKVTIKRFEDVGQIGDNSLIDLLSGALSIGRLDAASIVLSHGFKDVMIEAGFQPWVHRDITKDGTEETWTSGFEKLIQG